VPLDAAKRRGFWRDLAKEKVLKGGESYNSQTAVKKKRSILAATEKKKLRGKKHLGNCREKTFPVYFQWSLEGGKGAGSRKRRKEESNGNLPTPAEEKKHNGNGCNRKKGNKDYYIFAQGNGSCDWDWEKKKRSMPVPQTQKKPVLLSLDKRKEID